MTASKIADSCGNEAEIDAILEAIRHERRRERRDNAFLTGYAAAFDPFPTVEENWLSERAGLWADWSGLGRDRTAQSRGSLAIPTQNRTDRSGP